ncbi:MAG: glutamyl-tRNA amidotransferase [Candidatus Contendobacter odensis]|uniref:Glutamyl-tRNA amidotransferase n=1 Tax=Candidatus Contendibacter odensensis TaxID=1400860 RepID=A0A2G6PDN4_9GAMM|nr:MAG: glutamyl-tRNA amidotransferase [Candidatus Contendobacter odensis]
MLLKTRIQDDMKAAMRSKDKERLAVIRLILAAIKQREVDDRVVLDDTQTLAVLEKMIKQRRESLTQYQNAGRTDLADQETLEIKLIQGYLPEPLTEAELEALITDAIARCDAQSLRDMGKVMALVKAHAQGRADMTTVSAQVKARLSGA